MDVTKDRTLSLRRTVLAVAALNLAYFGVELGAALRIGSVSLLADSVDFLEDASVNLLIALALAWSVQARARLGKVLAGVLLLPALAMLWTLGTKIAAPLPPDPFILSLTGAGALAVNLAAALMLARHREHTGSLGRAAFLSARNDALANLAIITAGVVTAYLWRTAWPDVIVGLGIAAMNVDAARQVWAAAHDEQVAARAAAISAP